MTVAPEDTGISKAESRPTEYRLSELEVKVAELRDRGLSLGRIDSELHLGGGRAAKILKRLRNKAPGLIRLVRRLQDIQYWEKLLDRRAFLRNIRRIQSEAKKEGVWRYGRTPSGFWTDKDRKLRLEPIESEIIAICGERVLEGETVYKVAKDEGYDHGTLRDILKNPFYKKGGKHPGIFAEEKWKRIQQMLRSPPKGGVPWGFKRYGPRKIIDKTTVDQVRLLVDFRVKGWSANRIAKEFKLSPEIVVARLKRLKDPVYQEILGSERWRAFQESDERIKKLFRSL